MSDSPDSDYTSTRGDIDKGRNNKTAKDKPRTRATSKNTRKRNSSESEEDKSEKEKRHVKFRN